MTHTDKLKEQAAAIKEQKRRSKEMAKVASIKNKAAKAAKNATVNKSLFNPKKYTCWIFPCWQPENK